jgi:hypothetical protein
MHLRPRLSGRGAAVAPIAVAFAVCTAAALTTVAIKPPKHSQPGQIVAADFPDALLTRAWAHWDSGWYAAIAADGYWYNPGQQSPVAFFPAYPTAIGALHALGVNRFWAGILLTAVCGIAGLFLFNRWARLLHREPIALAATTLFAVYPFSFYLYGVMYSDAVFLLAVVGAFYALEKDKLWIAVALGIVATAARPVAPAVVIGLLGRRIEQRISRGERVRPVDLAPVLAGLGLVAYMAFLWYRFRDPLAFVHVQSAPGWEQPPGAATWLKLDLLERVRQQPTEFGTLVRLANGAAALGALALAVSTWRRWSKAYAVYIAIVVGIPAISSKDFMGLGRYVIAAFPLFVTLAYWLQARPRLRAAWVAASFAALVSLTMAFAVGRYVA